MSKFNRLSRSPAKLSARLGCLLEPRGARGGRQAAGATAQAFSGAAACSAAAALERCRQRPVALDAEKHCPSSTGGAAAAPAPATVPHFRERVFKTIASLTFTLPTALIDDDGRFESNECKQSACWCVALSPPNKAPPPVSFWARL